MAKAIDRGFNKVGAEFALVQNDDLKTFKVMKLCHNYAPHVRGGIAKTWRYVENRKGGNRMTLEDAEVLFMKRLDGTQRP